jgi:hypothetical protein
VIFNQWHAISDSENSSSFVSHGGHIAARKLDKAILAFPESRRIPNREHVRFVASSYGLWPAAVRPRHLRFSQSRGLGHKVSDEFTAPLYRGPIEEMRDCETIASRQPIHP